MRTSYIGSGKWVITTGKELGIRDVNNNLTTFSTKEDASVFLNVSFKKGLSSNLS